ncbi:MAG TPA: hypothetical protein VGM90_00380 [Kofleriaceae bacterium]
MAYVPFWLPLGDELIADWDGSLRFTDEMTAFFAGGPTQTVKGRISLTNRQLAFRPLVGMPHPQTLTLPLTSVSHVRRHRVFGVVASKTTVVVASIGGRQFELSFRVDDAEGFLDLLERTRVGSRPREQAAALLDAALRDGITERGRYTSTLAELSFPRTHWYTENVVALRVIVREAMAALELELPDGLVRDLDLHVETESGPEDYETGPGSEAWGRREQIARIVGAINAALPATEPRRFHALAEDLPDWIEDEPMCALLTAPQLDGLQRLGVVRTA